MGSVIFHLFFSLLCCLLLQLICLHAQLCSQQQTSALLQFKQQFSFNKSASQFCEDVGFASYPKLQSWKKGSDCCSWDGVECERETGQVIALHLNCSWLQGTMHPNSTLFHYFPHLQILDLSENDFGKSPIPSSIGRLTTLTDLDLSFSGFSGKVPMEVSFLTNLVSLYLLSQYDLTLEKPGFELLVQNLTHITDLYLANVNISSNVPISILNLTSLTTLDLISCGLYGKFPDGIFQLPHLYRLGITENNALTGYFPTFINFTSPLIFLFLGMTSFSGELIPDSINNLKSLGMFEAYSCKLYGSIPPSLGNLTHIDWLDLSHNNFTGILPSSLGNLTHIDWLDLSHNNFTGMLPASLSNLKNLTHLDLSNNHLTGPLPSQLTVLPNLGYLNISQNLISGTIPSWVFALPSMAYIDLSYNKFNGHINEFKSPSLEIINLSNNNLHGNVPSSTFELVNLTHLILSSNNFCGTIPKTTNFGKSVVVLDLKKNNFSGTVPDIFARGNRFKTINLNDNGFEGAVPKSLVNCTELEVLDLGNNKFRDTFPYWLENLPSLHVLIMQSNKFHGPVPTSEIKFPFPNLRVIDMSNNCFTGPLPKKYFKNFEAMMNVDEASYKLHYMGNDSTSSYGDYYHDSLTIVIKGSTIEMERVLNIFTVIDLSNNKFEGEIPEIIGSLLSIRGLNLSHNNLSGHIPTSLGNLTLLEWLDLSSNKLVGGIPQQLATRLTFLAVLNLSQNQLTGPIPRGNQFETFSNESYSGNLGLCGPPLSNTCSKTRGTQEDNNLQNQSGFDWGVIMSGYGCGLVFGLVMGYLMFSTGKPHWLVKMIEGQWHGGRKNSSKQARRLRGRRN